MSKLLGVFLPIALLLGWAGARLALQGRRARHALNVQSSVLLLVYFAITSGLGIFWVANQQLPVFDWHYLFGYATLALVGVHLLFNWRVVNAYLRRQRHRSATPTVADTRPRRSGPRAAGLGRPVVWTLALLAAFALGRRYGGGDLRVSWTAPTRTGDASPGLSDAILRFHEFSSQSRLGVFARAAGVEWGPPPPAFKRYPNAPEVALPRPRTNGRPTSEATSTLAPAAPAGGRVDVAAIADVLFFSSGVTRDEGTFKLRASPSSGALFPAELYVLARDVEGLAAGLYHYDPERHLLARLSEARVGARELGVLDAAAVERAPASVVVTALFRRSGQKYRDRAYRYVAADIGHLLENLRIAAAEAGSAAGFVARFDEARVASHLGIDGSEEGAMALVSLGGAGGGGALSAVLTAQASRGPARYRTAPPPEGEAGTLGPTALAHRATSLQLTEEPSAPPEADAPRIALPPPIASTRPVREAIHARRSRRNFSREPLPLAELASVLGHATRVSALYSQAPRLYVLVRHVSGLEPGAYRYEPASHALLRTRSGALAQEAESAALSQEVIGAAHAVLVTTFDRATLEAEGPRGYRHAFFEAGMMAERVYLEAEARGLGACSVGAFYDDEAARLLGISPEREWVAHFQALGRP
jgi:SagB-type dehydrogenase family enzyme